MKLLFTSILLLIISIQSQSQQFLWAESYDITNCNEVAAIAADTSGNLFITGVHDASSSLPYTGESYIMKTDPNGVVLWTEYISGSIQIGDMATSESSVVIIGKSNGVFSYQGEQYGSNTSYSMFIMKIDSAGTVEWCLLDEDSFGANTNLAIGKFGKIAAHIRGASNLGDWVWILGPNGNVLNTKEISASESTIVDIAYYDDWVYLNGGFNGPGSLIIDTIVINTQPVENTTFTLALNPDLEAKWVATDTTIHNFDGRIVASGSGIFVFETTLEPIFTSVNYIKKFGFDGQLIHEVVVPTFTTAVAMYPDLTITPNMVGLFTKNDFNSNSHAVFLFSTNLELISEKLINGSSSYYSGQITNFEDELYVGQIYSGDLIFGDEITLPYSGTGNMPYIAKIGTSSIVTGKDENLFQHGIKVYPNPAKEKISIHLIDADNADIKITIQNLSGKVVLQQNRYDLNSKIDLTEIQDGAYIIKVQLDSGQILHRKLIIQ